MIIKISEFKIIWSVRCRYIGESLFYKKNDIYFNYNCIFVLKEIILKWPHEWPKMLITIIRTIEVHK
jgi:hypothetical protein